MFGIETIQEFYALLKLYFWNPKVKDNNINKNYCYEQLELVSRSFSTVIQQLPKELQDPICIYYLVLRALDTIEDDPKLEKSIKSPILLDFYNEIEKRKTLENFGATKHQGLMKNFDRVEDVYLSLSKKYIEIIKESTKDMGKGMNEYLGRELDSIKEYDEYCYYVAGLVGEGLTKMFKASGIMKDLQIDEEKDSKEFNIEEKKKKLSVSMGLFLQKTNIIRDFLEDCEEDRVFWPKEIWGKYVKKVEDLKDPEYIKEALLCLNDMVMNALEHLPDSLEYLNRLYPKKGTSQEFGIFAFCAVPQVMAIATLAECYNNPKVFQRGSVKIRKGISARLFVETTSVKQVKIIYHFYLRDIKLKMHQDTLKDLETHLKKVDFYMKTTGQNEEFSTGTSFTKIFSYAFLVALSTLGFYYRKQITEKVQKFTKK